jgi:hypothetical protein
VLSSKGAREAVIMYSFELSNGIAELKDRYPRRKKRIEELVQRYRQECPGMSIQEILMNIDDAIKSSQKKSGRSPAGRVTKRKETRA